VFSDIDYGISRSTEQEGRYPVLKMGNIVDREIAYTNIEYVDDVASGLLLEKHDLLFNRTNSLDQVAKVAIFRGTSDDEVTFASYLVRLRTNRRNYPGFFVYLLNSKRVLELARKMAIPSVQQANLNPTRYCRLEVPVPPYDEQVHIAQCLDNEVSRIREIGQKLTDQIALLLQYRESLIHECVTGKRRITDSDVAEVQADV